MLAVYIPPEHTYNTQSSLIQSNPSKAASCIIHAKQTESPPPQLPIAFIVPDFQDRRETGYRARNVPEQVTDKHGEPIEKGDGVYTRIRGGRHEGEVGKVVTGQAEAEEKEGVENPPKVGRSVGLTASTASFPVGLSRPRGKASTNRKLIDGLLHRFYSRISMDIVSLTTQEHWSISEGERERELVYVT